MHPFISIKVIARPLFMGQKLCISGGACIGVKWCNDGKDKGAHHGTVADMVQTVKNIWLPYFERTKTIKGAYLQKLIGGHDEYLLALYHAKEGRCEFAIEVLDNNMKICEESKQNSMISYYNCKDAFEAKKIKQHIEDIEKTMQIINEKRNFFTNSTPESLAKHFEANCRTAQ